MRTAAQAFRRLKGALALALSFLPSVLIASGPSVPVLVDFRVAADYPLSKTKFAVYNSGFVPLQHYKRDEPLFRELRPESLRIDLWWGGGKWSRPPVSGTSEQLRFDFEEMDGLAELLNRNGIRPYWAYCYIPAPLQPPGTRDSRKFNNHFKMWGEAVAAFARHAREKGAGKTIGYHEIYNEPDNRDFFLGTMQDYFGMYREGSLAIRAADPDAIIGGPAVAFTDDWVSPFLDMVAGERLPLDFFSFHYYPGVPWKAKDLAGVVANIRGELAKHPALSTTEMHLNEFNSYRIDYPRGGRQDRFGIASAMLRDYKWFLSQPDLTRVHWAQFQDTAGGNWSGMISFDGHRKALFNAALIYARLPVDRVALQVNEVSGVDGLAAVENDRGGVVLWNNSGTNRGIEVAIKGLPFSKGTFRVFRIDAEHSSWGDKPEQERLEPVETMENVSLANFRWPGLLPASGVVYLEAEASNPPAR
ncbi:MAG TPA: hypothetical protein VN673_04815, partial [Clostridia bacterium]|nr:hypothetical protein [Clostridia bacterium]